MSSPTTKDDKKLAAAMKIRAMASSIQGFDASLAEAIDSLLNPDSSQARKNRAARALKEVKSQIGVLSRDLASNISVLCPISGLECVHSRQKRALVVDDTSNKENSPLPPPKKSKPQAVLPRKAALPLAIEIPTPKNGKQYSKMELVEVLSQHPKGSKACTNARCKIIQKGFVPIQRAMIDRLMIGFEKQGNKTI